MAHHHLVCRRCHETTHLDEALLGNLHEQLQKQFRFYNLTLDLIAAGYCHTCWQAVQQEGSHSQDEIERAKDDVH